MARRLHRRTPRREDSTRLRCRPADCRRGRQRRRRRRHVGRRHRAAAARAASRDLAAHLSLALEAGGLGTWRRDMRSGETDWDTKVEQLFGLGPGEFDGTFETYVSLLHPEDASTVLAAIEEAVDAKGSYVVDHRVVWPD